ncbi:hypothetical protein QL285_069393 [Trifolium repens]|jgi:hypothetical protein|nr:hypothetical protein QL285_069393 [Trifolium repens]
MVSSDGTDILTKTLRTTEVVENKAIGGEVRQQLHSFGERMKLVLSSAQNKTVALLRDDVVEMYLRLGFEAGQKRKLFLFVRGKERK